MKENIYDKINNYFINQKDISGNILYLDENIQIKDENQMNTTEELKNENSIDPTWNNSKSLDELYNKIHKCVECPLGEKRTNFVFGYGNKNADIMIIGEAPGKDEDIQGKPFVGRAGKLLTKILEAIKLSREEVFIANINKCRPPGNRVPTSDEVAKCEPYLQKQIDIIDPQFILSLGLTSVNTLLKEKYRMADIRGKIMQYHNRKLLATYHPAALLRNPQWKKATWEDVKLLRKLYDDYLEQKRS